MTDPTTASDDAVDPAIDIRLLDTTTEITRLVHVLNQVWGSATAVVGMELLRAIEHAGGYVAGAYAGEQMVGGSMGFLARHLDRPALHSHVTGVLPGVRRMGIGRTMKLHQRQWAADRHLSWVTWTFDPLVRRNAWFNIGVLGVEIHEYLVDFYGEIDDMINAGDESDRLLVAWPVDDRSSLRRPEARPTFTVPTPEDIVVLRRRSPAEAEEWRRRVRGELGGPLADGASVVGFTPDGEYVVALGDPS